VADLAGALAHVSQVEWTWIDIRIRLDLEMAPLEHELGLGPGAWGAPELREWCLAPRLPWII
jgi:hypothetical protein